MRLLIWGKGIDFNLIMKYVIWKNECEIVGFVESKKVEDTFVYKDRTFQIYEPNELRSVEYDYIIIANGYFAECSLISEKNDIDLDKIIVPYFHSIISNESAIINNCNKCMENTEEIIEVLNKQHNYMKRKRMLIYGDDRFLWQFLSVSLEKSNVEIIGVVTTTHSLHGYIKIFGKDIKVFEKCELGNLEFDMMLILDRNAPVIFAELSQKIDKSKMAIPFMTGIEENEYEIVAKLEPYIPRVNCVVDTLSTLYSSGRQPQHMAYDMLTHSIFNGTEYMRLGYPVIGENDGNDYGRIRTLELLISEIKEKKLNGEIAELGVFSGKFTKILHYYFPQKELYLYDTFEGFDDRDFADDLEKGNFTQKFANIFKRTSLDLVQEFVGKGKNIHYRVGYFPETILEEERKKKFCLISLDADLYNPTLEGLKFFYPRLELGGYIMIHEYNAICYAEGAIQNFEGVKKAVKDFERQYGKIQYVPIADRNGTLVITK